MMIPDYDITVNSVACLIIIYNNGLYTFTLLLTCYLIPSMTYSCFQLNQVTVHNTSTQPCTWIPRGVIWIQKHGALTHVRKLFITEMAVLDLDICLRFSGNLLFLCN